MKSRVKTLVFAVFAIHNANKNETHTGKKIRIEIEDKQAANIANRCRNRA